jgi:hypothetical protein
MSTLFMTTSCGTVRWLHHCVARVINSPEKFKRRRNSVSAFYVFDKAKKSGRWIPTPIVNIIAGTGYAIWYARNIHSGGIP